MARYQKYRLQWPLTPTQLVNIDEMFSELFTDLITPETFLPQVAASGRVTGQVAAQPVIASYTVANKADSLFQVSGVVYVVTATNHTFTLFCSYTDEASIARVQTLPVTQVAGTFLTAITNVTGVGPYASAGLTIRAKYNTPIVLGTVGTFTTVVYNASALITRLT